MCCWCEVFSEQCWMKTLDLFLLSNVVCVQEVLVCYTHFRGSKLCTVRFNQSPGAPFALEDTKPSLRCSPAWRHTSDHLVHQLRRHYKNTYFIFSALLISQEHRCTCWLTATVSSCDHSPAEAQDWQQLCTNFIYLHLTSYCTNKSQKVTFRTRLYGFFLFTNYANSVKQWGDPLLSTLFLHVHLFMKDTGPLRHFLKADVTWS